MTEFSKKIFIGFLLIILGFVFVMGWLLNGLTKSSLNKVELDHLVRISRTLENELIEKKINQETNLNDLCDKLSKRTGYVIYMINLKGELMAGSEYTGVSSFLLKQDVNNAIKTGFGTMLSTESQRYEIACSIKLDKINELDPFIMRVVQARLLSLPYLKAYRQEAWGMAFVALCFTILIMWVYSRTLATPFLQLHRLTKNLMKNEDRHSIEVQPYNKISGFVEVLNEIFRKNREKLVTILHQRNNHEAILSGMKEGLIALDENGHISEINYAAEQLLGVRGLRKRGRLLGEILRSRELIELQKLLTEKGESFETEIVVNKGTSMERIFQVSGYVSEESIETHHSLMVFTDITRLRKLENMRQEFVANVSHELKTPLTSIRGYAETLKGMAQFSEEIPQKFLGRVEQNADRLHNIIEDLMSLSRIEQNGLASDELEVLSIGFVFDRLKRELSQDSLERVEFMLNTEEHIVAHGLLLHQALFNLVDNALKYSGEGKEVKVIARDSESEKGIWFEVIDNGQGIAKDHLPNLTDRFYRADKARSRETGGSGLGLSIVKHIVESHGGKVEIDSVVGQGSEFKLFFPEIELEKN